MPCCRQARVILHTCPSKALGLEHNCECSVRTSAGTCKMYRRLQLICARSLLGLIIPYTDEYSALRIQHSVSWDLAQPPIFATFIRKLLLGTHKWPPACRHHLNAYQGLAITNFKDDSACLSDQTFNRWLEAEFAACNLAYQFLYKLNSKKLVQEKIIRAAGAPRTCLHRY